MKEDEFIKQCETDIDYLEKIRKLYRESDNTYEIARVGGKIEGVKLARDKYVELKLHNHIKRPEESKNDN